MILLKKLKSLPPDQIIDSAYEKVFKEEFMTTVQYKDLSKTEINALLKIDYLLDSLYQEWLKNDFGYIFNRRYLWWLYKKRNQTSKKKIYRTLIIYNFFEERWV